jgi:hypothetical protein
LNEAISSVYDAGCDACALQVDAAPVGAAFAIHARKPAGIVKPLVLATVEMFTSSSSQGFIQ